MNKRLIYAEDAIDAINELHDKPNAWLDLAVDALENLPSAETEQQNARIFQGIIVEYPTISTYPECEGKPYFSIKYTENGQEYIGYGTYKPEVLSEYLKEYFMPSAQPEQIARDIATIIENEQDMRVLLKNTERTEKHDLVSRKAAIKTAKNVAYYVDEHGSAGGWLAMLVNWLEILPSAQPEHTETHSCDYQRTETHESCTDCPLYDHDRQNCPRFNKVIPTAIRDAQQRWIPCSEETGDGYPEEDGFYYVTEQNYGFYLDADYKQRVTHTSHFKNGDFTDRFYTENNSNITAWMPLPEPYKEGTE